MICAEKETQVVKLFLNIKIVFILWILRTLRVSSVCYFTAWPNTGKKNDSTTLAVIKPHQSRLIM